MYKAIVDYIKLEDIGANTLQKAWYGGLPYLVSKDMTESELCLIFPPDGQLSTEYAEANDLVARYENGKRVNAGFFGQNRKVRSIKLMGGQHTSVGFIAPLSSLSFTGYDTSKLERGQELDALNGFPICNKFISQSTRDFTTLKKQSKKREEMGLYMHKDTEQFYKFAEDIKPGSLCIITLKLHGTSIRTGNALVERKLKWYETLINRIAPIKNFDYQTLVASRRVIIGRTKDNYYGSDDLWLEQGNKLSNKLLPGECVYGEIVGWINTTPIQRGFSYGQNPGTRQMYVYNITLSTAPGHIHHYSWSQIKRRCNELGLKFVPEMILPFYYYGDVEALRNTVYSLVDGSDIIDPTHIREGVVLRVEDGNTKFYKAKSRAFYELEDKSKEANEVDIEEAN